MKEKIKELYQKGKHIYNEYNLTFLISIIGCLVMLVFQIIGLANAKGVFYISSTIYFSVILIIRIVSEILLVKHVSFKTNSYFVTIGNVLTIIPLPFTLLAALYFKDNFDYRFEFIIYLYALYAFVKIINAIVQTVIFKNRTTTYMIVMRNYNLQSGIYTMHMMAISLVKTFGGESEELTPLLISMGIFFIALSIWLVIYDFKVIRRSNLLRMERIFKVLKKNDFKNTDNIIIHSSLKSIGKIEGDAKGLIDALKKYFNEGMILFPTHTWSFMNKDNDELNLLEANSCVGTLNNEAIKCGFKRSHHPTHSVCGYGKNIDEYLKFDDDAKTPASPNGCFGNLKNYNFKIIFLGAKISKNTFIHSIEEEYNVADRFTSHIYTFYSNDGIKKYEYHLPKHYTPYNPHISDNYIKLYEPLKKKKILKEFMFGNAKSCYIDAKKCYDYVSNILKDNNHYFDTLE